MRFEVLKPMIMGPTLCSLVEVDRRFGGRYCLHHQGRRRRRASRQETGTRADAACLLCLFFNWILYFMSLSCLFSRFLFYKASLSKLLLKFNAHETTTAACYLACKLMQIIILWGFNGLVARHFKPLLSFSHIFYAYPSAGRSKNITSPFHACHYKFKPRQIYLAV
jgi:hypothetical protein